MPSGYCGFSSPTSPGLFLYSLHTWPGFKPSPCIGCSCLAILQCPHWADSCKLLFQPQGLHGDLVRNWQGGRETYTRNHPLHWSTCKLGVSVRYLEGEAHCVLFPISSPPSIGTTSSYILFPPMSDEEVPIYELMQMFQNLAWWCPPIIPVLWEPETGVLEVAT